MKQIMKKVPAVIMLLTFGVILAAGAAFASEGEPGFVPLLEINDENLISIAEDLKTGLQVRQEHLDMYSASPEIMELGQKADDLFTGSCTETHVLTIDPVEVMNALATPAEIEEAGIGLELLDALGMRIGTALANKVNADMGVDYIALSSMITASRSFVADLDQEIIVVQEYDGECSMITDFFASGEHVMAAAASIIPSEKVQELLEMVSPEN